MPMDKFVWSNVDYEVLILTNVDQQVATLFFRIMTTIEYVYLREKRSNNPLNFLVELHVQRLATTKPLNVVFWQAINAESSLQII